jgi:lycopene beta-cyclase
MTSHHDLIIIGGGCAGLSLAARLGSYGADAPRTLVVDSRAGYSNDRTWCFWRLPGAAATELVEYEWPEFRVAGAGREEVVDCAETPYCAIPGDRFYEASRQAMGRSERVELIHRAPVYGAVGGGPGRWEVETPGGRYTATHVVDTRPGRAPRQGDALLWQSFLGAEVEVSQGAFDARQVTLMDFGEAPGQRMVFSYILPFSARRALVEVTEFSPYAVAPGELEPLLRGALARLGLGEEVRRVRTEEGVLPMGMVGAAPGGVGWGDGRMSYVQAGVAGGGARACTGYAFQRIQRWAARCAEHLMEHGSPVGHEKDPATLAFLDHLFLRVLRDRPQLAPRLFAQLFGEAATGSVLRFLGDRATAGDILRVVAALPPGPFVKALVGLCAEPAAAWRESFVS